MTKFSSDDPQDDKQRRGYGLQPSGQECKRGHLDWEIITDPDGHLVKRCRICGDQRDFSGQVLPS